MSGPRPDKTPVTILTGFLGSGKTSLLNGALKDPGLRDSAVVVNELGEIALDHLLVSEGQENIVLTQTGCLCCAALDSLPETLLDLFGRRARKAVPDFRRVFIETTGLADPAPILRAVLRDPVLSHFARLDGLICTVDAVLGSGQLDAETEAQAQAAMADRIIVTKTDAAGAAAEALTARLRRLNTACEIVEKGAPADFAWLLRPLDAGLSLATSQAAAADHTHDHDHTVAGPRHDVAVASICVWVDGPVTWAGLAAWTDWARARFGPALLRCKGLIAVAGVAGPVALQGVQTMFETTRMGAWPDPDHRSRLVLIGRGLSEPDILASLPLLSTTA